MLQNDPGLNVQDILGVFGFNLVSPVDTSSAQALRGHNIPNSSGSTHDPVLQKVFFLFLKDFHSLSLSLFFIEVSNSEDSYLVLLGCWLILHNKIIIVNLCV